MQYQTTTQIYNALGLDPLFSPSQRPYGLTTRMLVRAALETQHGEVLVCGYNELYTDMLQENITSMLEQLKMPTTNLVYARVTNQQKDLDIWRFYTGRGVRLYPDHYQNQMPFQEKTLRPKMLRPATAYEIQAEAMRIEAERRTRLPAEMREMLRRRHREHNLIPLLEIPDLPIELGSYDYIYRLYGRVDRIDRIIQQKSKPADSCCSNCAYYSGDRHLRCAVFPQGDVSACKHHETIEG
jgi:hypothetical protein